MSERVKVVAELGINHNGDVALALRLINEARSAGADEIKLQKRTPKLCVPRDQWDVMRDTPWGRMTYMAYKEKMEFGAKEYGTIDAHCRDLNMPWTVSVWDVESLAWMEQYFPRTWYKVPSACITDMELLGALNELGKPAVISTGMSTADEVRRAVRALPSVALTVCHANSTYPCPPEDLNLRCITALQEEFPWATVGYSGHEVGLAPTLAAVALGAMYIERHFTLDRTLWGSDHSASVEPSGFRRMVKDIRLVEKSLGDGHKRVTQGEQAAMQKLRRVRATV